MMSFPSSNSLSTRAWLTGGSQHLKWGGGVLYHSGSGRIFLVFGQDPSHSDEGLIPYMRYNPPCMATRPVSFASDHLICLRPNRAEPNYSRVHHQTFSRQAFYLPRVSLTSAQHCGFYFFGDKGADHFGKGDNRNPDG